jgi:hypothetical protein
MSMGHGALAVVNIKCVSGKFGQGAWVSLATCEYQLKSADSAASYNGTLYRELPGKQAAKVVVCVSRVENV